MADDFIPDDGFVPDTAQQQPATPKAPFNANPVTDIARQVGQDFASALTAAYEGLNPYSATHAAISEQGTKPDDPAVDRYAGTAGRAMSHLAAAGKGALAVPAAVFAAPVGAYESLVGHSLADVGDMRTPQEIRDKVQISPEEAYERAKSQADVGLNALPAGRLAKVDGLLRVIPPLAPPSSLTKNFQPASEPFGITLSKGEETGDLAARQAEQTAIRNADPHAQEWIAQRQQQLAAAEEELARRMDAQRRILAQTPQDAGQIVSETIQQKAAASKEAVRQAYEQARTLPGTFEPGVFDNMTDGIRSDLSLADKPVDLDDKLTPFASKMVNVLDDRIAAAKPKPLSSGMRLYHGSPEDFTEFDPAAIGSNYGATDAHGFFLTNDPEVARTYGPFGYEVNVRATPEQFLDRHKDIGAQSPTVQAALRKVLGDAEFNRMANERLSGADAYDEAIRNAGGDLAGANNLKRNGIVGTKNDAVFQDPSSPTIYSVFDPKKLQILNKFDANSTPPAINGIDLNGVDKIRKVLSSYRSDAMASGNAADGRAAQAVLNAFDKRIDDAVNGGNFTGDKTAINAWNNARAANADYRSTFTAQKRDPVGRAVQKILGDNINDPLTPAKVIDQIVGSAGIAPSTLNIAITKRIKSVVGEQSPVWTVVRQGLLKRILSTGEGETEFSTGQRAQRLSKFLNSDISKEIYNPQQLATLRGYRDVLRQVTMPAGSYFPSAPPLMHRISAELAGLVGAVVGGTVGHAAGLGVPLLGELGGIALGRSLGKRAYTAVERYHSDLPSKLPLVGKQMKQWQQAFAKAQKTPTEPNRAAVAFAANNLAQTLAPLGIDLQKLLYSPPAFGGPNQDQQNQAPMPQQNRGGRVNQQRYAAGGSVKTHQGKPIVHPRVPNAHLAHDGHYYAHDPKRPGKFLKVVEAPGRAEGGAAPAVDQDVQDWDSLPKDAAGRPIVSVSPTATDPAMFMPMPKYSPPLRPIPEDPHNEWGDTLPASKGEAIGEGLAQGATAGWSHQIRAAQKASGVPDWVPGQLPVGAARLAWEHLTGQSDGPASTAYNEALLKIQNRAAKIREDHPYLEQGAEWVGAAASMGIVAPEVGMFPPALAGLKLGAGYGGLYGASQKAEEFGLTDVPEVAKGAVKGALVGGGTGMLGASVAANPATRAAIGATIGSVYGAKKGYDKEGWAGVPKSAIEYGTAGALALPAAGYVGENAIRSLGQKAGVLPFRIIKTPGEPAPPPNPSRALLPDVTPDAAPDVSIAPPTIAGPTSNLPSLVDAIKQRFEVPDDVAQGIRSQLLANPDLQTIRIPGKASLPWPVSRFGGQLSVGQNLRDLARYEASQPAVRLAQEAEARYSAGANLDQKVRDIVGMHNLPPTAAPAIREQLLADPTRTEINVGAHTFEIGPLTIGLGPHQANLAAPPSWSLSFGGKDVNLARAQGAAKSVNAGNTAARTGLFPPAPLKGAPAETPSSNVIPLPLKTPAVAERSPAQAISDRWSKPEPYDTALEVARTLPSSPARAVADRWIQPSPDLPLALQNAAEEVRASAQRPYDFPAQYRIPHIERNAHSGLFPRGDRPVIDLVPEESPARTVVDRWIQPRTVAGLVP